MSMAHTVEIAEGVYAEIYPDGNLPPHDWRYELRNKDGLLYECKRQCLSYEYALAAARRMWRKLGRA